MRGKCNQFINAEKPMCEIGPRGEGRQPLSPLPALWQWQSEGDGQRILSSAGGRCRANYTWWWQQIFLARASKGWEIIVPTVWGLAVMLCLLFTRRERIGRKVGSWDLLCPSSASHCRDQGKMKKEECSAICVHNVCQFLNWYWRIFCERSVVHGWLPFLPSGEGSSRAVCVFIRLIVIDCPLNRWWS